MTVTPNWSCRDKDLFISFGSPSTICKLFFLIKQGSLHWGTPLVHRVLRAMYGPHPPMVIRLNCSRKKIGKLGFGVEQHWQLLFLFRLLIHGVRGGDKGSESLEVGKGSRHSEPGPAQVQHLHLVPLTCKYNLTLAGSNGGCGRSTAERRLFSDAVPEDVTLCTVAQVMCHRTGEEGHD